MSVRAILLMFATFASCCGGVVVLKDGGEDVADVMTDVTDGSPPPFYCGDAGLICDPETQYCYVVHLGSPTSKDFIACDVPEGGGKPGCTDANAAPGPNLCGCWETDAGEVTLIACPP